MDRFSVKVFDVGQENRIEEEEEILIVDRNRSEINHQNSDEVQHPKHHPFHHCSTIVDYDRDGDAKANVDADADADTDMYDDGDDRRENNRMTTSMTNKNLQRLFTKELCLMMYGFGDAANPYVETVNLLEDLVLMYINHLVHKAIDNHRRKKRISSNIVHQQHQITGKIWPISIGSSMMMRSLSISNRCDRITIDDLMFALRKIPNKYFRVRNLISMNFELKNARKAFDDSQYVSIGDENDHNTI
ncbi:dedicator of cytokinesis protein 3 [Sarcoptes scabiei]|nr:dedicator of cytokinesis protein 3 [Sarcoptes scabiei]